MNYHHPKSEERKFVNRYKVSSNFDILWLHHLWNYMLTWVYSYGNSLLFCPFIAQSVFIPKLYFFLKSLLKLSWSSNGQQCYCKVFRVLFFTEHISLIQMPIHLKAVFHVNLCLILNVTGIYCMLHIFISKSFNSMVQGHKNVFQ